MPDPIAFIGKVKNSMRKHGMTQPGERVVAAVSGGADSVCLLDVLYALKDVLGIELTVAHFNHGLRPGEDQMESDFTAGLAHARGLAFECGRSAQALAGQPSLEEKAREARYAFLEEVRQRYAAHRVALAHQMNDQAETILMRLIRGSGTEGLAGIPPTRGGILIRPLIERNRGEIEAYLRARGLAFMVDPSNLSKKHLRNRIRLELLPLIETLQPRAVEHLAMTAELTRLDQSFLRTCAMEWMDEQAQVEERQVTIPTAPFATLHEALKNHIIRETIRMMAGSLRKVNVRHVQAVKALSLGNGSGGPIRLPNALIAERVYGNLRIASGALQPGSAYSYPIGGPGTYNLTEPAVTLTVCAIGRSAGRDLRPSPWKEYLDAAKVVFPLTLRSVRPGDRFHPLGMRGTRKVKDFLIDHKIPRTARRMIPVLSHKDDSEILWVCGLRIDDHFKLTPKTMTILEIALRKWD